MDRFAAMIILLGVLVGLVLSILAFFTVAPITCSCLLLLLYSLYWFMAYEESGIHHAQEFENRFWTTFAVLLSSALFFAKDSPIAFGLWWSPTLGFVGVVLAGYAMHVWDRYLHRIAIGNSQQNSLMRLRGSFRLSHQQQQQQPQQQQNQSTASASSASSSSSSSASGSSSLQHTFLSQSLLHLRDLGIPVEDQLAKINQCLSEIDQLLIPSTINNFINKRYVQAKEREIITVFEECDARALNYLIGHVKLGLLFYKIKDHFNFHGKHRTELINLLAVERLPVLTVMSRVIVLHSLQLLKLRANPRAESWVHHILVHTHQDDLSELKTLTDAKGDYFCMNKLIYDDIRSESIRQDILHHIRREAAVQQTHWQMGTASSKSRRCLLQSFSSNKKHSMTWRKVLSDVDDTLYCSGGMYPAGIDKRFSKKTVYPGALAFYRELDLGHDGPAEWQEDRVGNLVFLSARPHLYKDISEKHNFAKFEKLRARGDDGRQTGMHTTPSLLAGDLASGSQYLVSNDFEPLARKKFDNFRRYVNLYPEYQHVFVCDNGQGDVRAGEMMFDGFPYEFEALYVHIVQDIHKTYGYNPVRWQHKEFYPFFFKTYPEAALHAASRHPPLIRLAGLRRICQDSVKDFAQIQKWPSESAKVARREELNQAIWQANLFLQWNMEETVVELIQAEPVWSVGEKVRTPYGIAVVLSHDPVWDLYQVELDWRPLNVQVAEHAAEEAEKAAAAGGGKSSRSATRPSAPTQQRGAASTSLATVMEMDENAEDDAVSSSRSLAAGPAVATTTTATSPLEEASDVSAPPHEPTQQQQEGGEPSAERHAPTLHDVSTSRTTPLSTTNDSPAPPSESSMPDRASLASVSDSSEDASSIEEAVDMASTFFAPAPPSQSSSTTQKGPGRSGIKATLSGRSLSKYTPPTLPRFDDNKRSSLFTFFQSPPKRPTFKEGDEYNSPYGLVHVVEHRVASGIVVVDMIGWHARAYLQQDILVPVPQNLLRSLLRKLSATDATMSTTTAAVKASPPSEFPYAQGTEITTPFGDGSVTRPLPLPTSTTKAGRAKMAATQLPSSSSSSSSLLQQQQQPQTLGLSLDSWTLADGTHPMLYCTEETARAWKERKDNTSFFSTIGSFVTSSLLEPFLTQPQQKPVVDELPKKFDRYFKDAAAVSTPYGNGRVVSFRESDGFYQVALTQWKLANGQNPHAHVRGVDLRCCLARGCQEGDPVLTTLGLSGRLASVEPTTGVHIVTIPTAGMVCYLQPECIVRPLKAAVGEEVLTQYGMGTVTSYDLSRDMYTISMKNWNATLYGKPDTFDRVGEGIQERDGPFGVNWLLRLLFFKPSPATDTSAAAAPRSRSNSIVSGISQKSNKN